MIDTAAAPDPAPPPQKRRRGLYIAGVVAAAFAVIVGLCEWQGWPFLARPAERVLSDRLQREVRLSGKDQRDFSLRLLGHIQVKTSELSIANASWAAPAAGPMLVAEDVALVLRWRDLLALRDGRPLRVQSLRAGSMQAALERRGDGRANWQFAPAQTKPSAEAGGFGGVDFGLLQVDRGGVRYVDEIVPLDLDARFELTEGQSAGANAGLRAQATGRYGVSPLSASLSTGSAMPWVSDNENAPAVPVDLKVQAGQAKLAFTGQLRDLFGRRGVQGRYEVSGPSLAAVGQPLRLTLPTTRPFAMRGLLSHEGQRWYTVIDRATVGDSRLAGEFTFDKPANGKPTLAGRLRGPALLLRDLGPAIGVPTEPRPQETADDGRVLPDRRFDLPSLRAMNANVLVALDRLDLNSKALQSIQPLRAHLVLNEGVLEIKDIDARLAQGRLQGRIMLDGRQPAAQWAANLTGTGLRIEQWIRPLQRADAPPYASGLLGGRVDIKGQGRSSAELLASADGRVILHWTQGSISHLAVEAAGIDVAQALGVLIRGDDDLPVRCGAGDLTIKDGRVTPRVLLVDTRDSTFWMEGGLSLADEKLDLTARVAPKDWSPLALRTPVRIEGSLSEPDISLEKGPLMKRLLPAVLLAAAVQPLAALLPLIDTSDDEAAKAAAQACRQVAERYKTVDRKAVGIG
jgi:AsmA family protein